MYGHDSGENKLDVCRWILALFLCLYMDHNRDINDACFH